MAPVDRDSPAPRKALGTSSGQKRAHPVAVSAQGCAVRLEALAVAAGPLPAAHPLCFGAIELFAERAKGIAPHFALTDANKPMVTELCAAPDGLPLGTGLFAQLRAEGETLPYTQISALAFGAADSADLSLAAAQRLQA